MPSSLLTRLSTRRIVSPLARSLATSVLEPSSSKLPAFAFAKDASVTPSAVTSLSGRPMDQMLKGKGLMMHLKKTLPSPVAKDLLAVQFNRRHPDRLLPGSVLTVITNHAPTNFSGVLIGVRYKGPDTSFTLRNVVQRTGVEMTFMACSPALKEIKVVHKAGGGGGRDGRRIRRAKLFYLRDQPAKMAAISTSIKRTQK